jgi:hypothetical protein
MTEVTSAIWGALTLDADAYRALQDSPDALRIGIVLLVSSGLSWTVGHSAVLFLNRVPPHRFVGTSLLLTSSFIAGILTWVGSTWLIATLFPASERVPLVRVVDVAAFAYAPIVLSIFIVLPYIGAGIETVLNTWALLALVLAVSVAFQLSLATSLLACLLGWALTKLLPRLLGGRVDTAWNQLTTAKVRARGEAAALESVTRLRDR